MFSLIRTYFMDVFHMTYVKNTTFQKKNKKKSKKYPFYEDKSDNRQTVVYLQNFNICHIIESQP